MSKTIVTNKLFLGALAGLILGIGIAACGGGGGGTVAGAVPGGGGGAPGGGAPAIPPTCGSTSGPLTLSFVASRLTGVAPLAVFFDATASTSTNPILPFHDMGYGWDFGDPGGGTWGQGARSGVSKNLATGAVAAHVFETPGTYTVTLAISDGTNTVVNNCAVITVNNPDVANTTCVNALGADHTGCPLVGVGMTYANSAACVTAGRCVTNADFDVALTSYLGVGAAAAGKRVLFKGGDTFVASVVYAYNAAGPTEIGAYGTGRPIIQYTGSDPASGYIYVAGTSSDLRVVGIEFDGQSQTDLRAISFQNTAWGNALFLNTYLRNLWSGYQVGMEGTGLFVVNNVIDTIGGAAGAMSIFVGSSVGHSSQVAVLGNSVSQAGFGEQALRLNAVQKFVISNNTVSGSADTKETISIRSEADASQYGVISNNHVTVGPGYVGIFPVANAIPGMTDIIVEGNYIVATASTASSGIETGAERVSIRNNIIDGTDVNTTFGIALRGVGGGGIGQPAKDVRVYNNSIFSGKVSGTYTAISVNASVSTGNVIKNNLFHTSGITGTGISDTGGLATKSNNTGDPEAAPGIITLNPGWTITTPMTPLTNFTPVGSYAIDKGTPVPVLSDFFGATRTGVYDLGAVNP